AMNDILRERLLRKLEALSEEKAYQVLDYIEFLESKYAERPAGAPAFQKVAETLEDTLRAGRVPVKIIKGTMDAVGKAGKFLEGLAAAGKAAVERVKRSESGMILNPITLGPDRPLREAQQLMARFKISGVPIVDADGKLVGIITNRDLQFERQLDRPIRQAMTKDKLVTAPVGTDLDEAEKILAQHRIEKLPVVDMRAVMNGLIA